jgi:hypothetical protein
VAEWRGNNSDNSADKQHERAWEREIASEVWWKSAMVGAFYRGLGRRRGEVGIVGVNGR